jgi:hypothetical protein
MFSCRVWARAHFDEFEIDGNLPCFVRVNQGWKNGAKQRFLIFCELRAPDCTQVTHSKVDAT